MGSDIEGLGKPVEYGRGLLVREGLDVTLIAAGCLLGNAVKAAILLCETGVSCEIIDPRFLKPLDESLIRKSLLKTGRAVVIEDGITNGGFGSSILEFANREGMQSEILLLGLPNMPIEHGPRDRILKRYGLDPVSIKNRVLGFIGNPILKGAAHAKRAP